MFPSVTGNQEVEISCQQLAAHSGNLLCFVAAEHKFSHQHLCPVFGLVTVFKAHFLMLTLFKGAIVLNFCCETCCNTLLLQFVDKNRSI